MTALLLVTLAALSEKLMLLTTHVESLAEMGGKGSARAPFDARAVLNRQCSRVLATSQLQRSGPQNESAPMSLGGMLRVLSLVFCGRQMKRHRSEMKKVNDPLVMSRRPTEGPAEVMTQQEGGYDFVGSLPTALSHKTSSWFGCAAAMRVTGGGVPLGSKKPLRQTD